MAGIGGSLINWTLPESGILELGCGAGHLWVENLNRIPRDWDVKLSDLSPGMLQEAQRNLCNSQRDFQFAVIDAQAIPYPDKSFDAVAANHMFYHVPERMKALAEIRRVLRPGGRLYTSTVGRAHLPKLWEWVSRFDPGAELWAARVTESFVLENGFDQLSPLFPQVTMHRYDDDLVITAVEPLIAFVLDTSAKSALTRSKLAELVHFMEQELTSHGAICITKDSGIFACIRP
jgi:ubiquinone/menaquinone biosynthesis C-methylase UbiE